MADASVSLDLDAQQLYRELQQVQSHFAEFASKATTAGDQAATNFTTGFGSKFSGGISKLGSALEGGLGTLGIGIGVGAAVGELKHVIDVAHEIHHEAERFNIDAESLQLIGNAAKEDGLSLEQVARAMNQLAINAQAALNPTSKQGEAAKLLNIEAKEFAEMNVADKWFALGEAYNKSAKDGEAYAAVASLIGKRNTEAIPTLERTREEVEKLSNSMGIMSTETTENLNKAYGSMRAFENQIVTGLANGINKLVEFGDFMDKWADKVNVALVKAGVPGVVPGTPVFEGGGGGFGGTGAGSTWDVVTDKKRLGDSEDELTNKQQKAQEKAETADEKKLDAQREKVEKGERDQELKDLPARERLESLKKDAAAAQTGIAESRDEEDRLDFRQQYLDITKEIKETEKEIAADAKKEERDAAAEKKKNADDAAKAYKQAQTDAIKAGEDEERRVQHDRERTLNPANLTLHDIASARIIGNPAVAQAQQAEAEEKLAKERQLAGDLPGAREHKDRAEQLKKELGLENEIDREASFQKGLDKSEVLKSIRDNTADMKANKA